MLGSEGGPETAGLTVVSSSSSSANISNESEDGLTEPIEPTPASVTPDRMAFPELELSLPKLAIRDGPSPLNRARLSYPSERINKKWQQATWAISLSLSHKDCNSNKTKQ